MCGIVGLTDTNNFHFLSKMNNLLKYRGPDDSGEYVHESQNVAFAMRRLAIIDVETGKQPMQDSEGDLCIIFNGEIYNAPELRRKLIAKRFKFLTKNSDTEVLLNLYKEKGQGMLNYLNGMFSFVIHDKRKRLLFGARDNAGIKPFYYSFKAGKFAFASELKSLLVLPWVSRDINFASLYHYISLQFIPAPDSIFDDIKKLPAGHFFVYNLDNKSLKIEKYWDLHFNKITNKPVDFWIKTLRKNIENAVKRWTLSDVPIACSLSGGLDSSSIVGILAKSGMENIKTYSLGFDKENEQEYNELLLARNVAQKWKTEHHEVILKSKEVIKDLKKMVWHLDEPYGGGLPSWYVHKIISKDVKVALTGTGGDELFGNYGKFSAYEQKRFYYWRNLLGAIKRRSIRDIKNYFKYPAGHFYPRYFSDAFKDEKILVKNNRYNDILKTEALLEKTWNASETKNHRNSVAYVDFKMQLPEEFLFVTDRFSMAHSIEARVPFLEKNLVELAFQIPPSIRTNSQDHKYLLKKVVSDLLPKKVLSASKKGFVLPLKFWTRNDLKYLIEEKLSHNYLVEQNIFSPKIWKNIITPHLTERKDNTQQVWTLLMFQLWYEEYLVNN